MKGERSLLKILYNFKIINHAKIKFIPFINYVSDYWRQIICKCCRLYVYSASGVYTEISGDTVVAFSTSTITNPFDLDDVTYSSNRIPFFFRFNGVNYNNISINTNGFITFGAVSSVAANYGPIASTETYDGAVSAFGIDLIGLFGTNADRSAGSPVLSNVVSFAGVVAGRLITGTGIATSATIISFNQSAGTITMSAGATSTGNNEIIQIAAASIVRSTQGISGSRVHTIQFKTSDDI